MHRSYLITHNNPKVDPQEYLESWLKHGARYVNGQLEKCPSTGTIHIQAYVTLDKPARIPAMKKKDPIAHFEPVKKENGAAKYCLKEDTRVDGPWEFGKKPLNPADKVDWEEVRSLAKQGKLDEVDPGIYVRYYNNLKRIQKDHMVCDGQADECKGVWIYGPAGAGKSRTAREQYPGAYKKLANIWWCGYQGEKYVLLEDLDKFHVKLGYYLKLWGDRYHCLGETKGGQVPLTHEKIVVTSQYHWDAIWEDQETRDAIKRRFHLIHIPKLV